MPQTVRSFEFSNHWYNGSWGGVPRKIGRIQFTHSYDSIISVENLLTAWKEFIKGKRTKRDVQEFQFDLMNNVLSLREDLKRGTYRHGRYEAFKVNDPKPRHIHKAIVRDRLLHRAIYRKLYPFFDRTFIADSFSCRNDKGTHKALNRLRALFYRSSKNNTKTCWVLKCDIRKFFASVDHVVLGKVLAHRIVDTRIQGLLTEIIGSFHTETGKGLPLGNLTSQLFANVYLNKLDQFVKHKLKVRYYVRYADDFVVMSQDREQLSDLLRYIVTFLRDELSLELHPNKIFVKALASGVDFLGWVHFPDHQVLRTVTKRRMLKRVNKNSSAETTASYLGLLSHGNARGLRNRITELLR